jgi:16S rRNA (cytidine1402-2'-O)-methyltransferase
LFSFVPTPIGNLGDISIRSLQRLAESEIVFCEDTRVSKSLLNLLSNRYPEFFKNSIDKRFFSMHSHNEKEILEKLDLELLQNGIYMSDAGMAGISDPGIELLNFLQKKNLEFEVLPGASASSMAQLLSGFEGKSLFFGFLPHKKSREKELEEVLFSGYNTTLFEAPHRLLKLLKEISEIAPEREIFVGKELTKKFEQRWWGRADEVLKEISSTKGEWVVVVKGERKEQGRISVKDLENANIHPKEKAKLLSKLINKSSKEIYKELILK